MINRWMSPRRTGLRDAIEQLFEDPFLGRPFGNRMRGLGEEQWVPVNIFEHPEGLMIVAPMPGLQADDVDIHVTGTMLTLRGNRSPGQEDREYMVKEWDYGPYQRSIELPFPVDMDQVGATLDNGVLTVNLRKAESVMPRKIAVRSGSGRTLTGGESHRGEERQEREGMSGSISSAPDVDITGGV